MLYIYIEIENIVLWDQLLDIKFPQKSRGTDSIKDCQTGDTEHCDALHPILSTLNYFTCNSIKGFLMKHRFNFEMINV